MRLYGKRRVACLWSIIFLTAFVMAGPVFAEGFLFKDERAKLADKGIGFSLSTIQDYATVLNGGLSQRSTWASQNDAKVFFDTAKLGLWKGGTLMLHGTNYASSKKLSGELIGDTQTADWIEAPASTRLMELWYEQEVVEGKLFWLGGLHDMNADFGLSQYGGLYINYAFCFPPATPDNTDLSTSPMTSLGTRMKFSPTEKLAFLAGVYNGTPGDPTINKHNTHVTLNNRNGLFSIVEGQYQFSLPLQDGLPGTFKLGGWQNSKNVPDLTVVDEETGDPAMHKANYGGYAIMDQMLWRENSDQGLGAFFTAGAAPADRNGVERSLTGGLNYTGLIPGRDADQLGMAYSTIRFSGKGLAAMAMEKAENVYELTYAAKITEDITVQPDFQYIQNPSGDATIKNASVLTFRTNVKF